MQIFIKGLDGKTFSLEAQTFDLVEAIMMKIAERNETPYKYIRLIYQGKQLHPDKTLSEYEIGPEATIHLVARLLGGSSLIAINVKTMFGKTYIVTINPRATIAELKKEFMELDGTWWEYQQMLFRNELLDNDMALELYGIENGSNLMMVPKFRKCSCDCSGGCV